VAYKRMVKYEVERDKEFAKWAHEVVGGERIRDCIQCGFCSASCPLATYMDLTPRRLINMAREGFKKDVLESFTIWLCTSCYSCTVQCPRQIRVTDIMYALKRRAIEEGCYPSRFPVAVLAKEFNRMVRGFGRVTETWLVAIVFLKSAIMQLFEMTGLGMGLLRTGRFSVIPDSIKARKQLRVLLKTVESGEEVVTQ